MSHEITNQDDVIDSRDIIERIEELEDAIGSGQDDSGDVEELKILKTLAEEASSSPDWNHGETLIRRSYFVDYIEELISDCYEIPKGDSWPLRHLKMDYEAAAEEAEQDYMEVDFDGVEYLIRA